MFLVFGSLISWVPLAKVISGIAILIGAVLIIKGREAFEREHSRNVIRSVKIFASGVVVYVTTFVISDSIVLFLVVSVVIGIASVLFTYALQKAIGRALLWTAFTLVVILSGVEIFFIAPTVNTSGGSSIISEILPVTSLLGIPIAIFYVVAFYQARKRIAHGEIPYSNHPVTLSPEDKARIDFRTLRTRLETVEILVREGCGPFCFPLGDLLRGERGQPRLLGSLVTDQILCL